MQKSDLKRLNRIAEHYRTGRSSLNDVEVRNISAVVSTQLVLHRLSDEQVRTLADGAFDVENEADTKLVKQVMKHIEIEQIHIVKLIPFLKLSKKSLAEYRDGQEYGIVDEIIKAANDV